MRNRIVFGLLFVALGLLVMATPFYLLPVCETTLTLQSGASVPMKCHWTARAELGAGAVLAALGLLCLLLRDPGARFGVTLGVLPMAALIAALPAFLIGVCGSPEMACHAGTWPGLMILSVFAAASAVFAALSFRREARRDARSFSPPGRSAR